MSLETVNELEQRRRKRINASSNALSLWLSLLAFQVVRFVWFVWMLRSDTLVSYIMYGVGGSLYLEAMILGWIVAKHGFAPTGDSPFAVIKRVSPSANWNPLRWNIHAMASLVSYLCIGIPALWYVMFLEPGRLFKDGPFVGPSPLSELQLPTTAGAFEFSDGHVHHALGGAVDYSMARSVTKVFYADPFGDDSWDKSQPTQVWVIHEEGEEITPKHRFAYVITKQNAHRIAYQKAVANSEKRFHTRSAEHAIMVRLDTRPPRWPNGPGYLQVLGAMYLATGVYVGAYARRLTLFGD